MSLLPALDSNGFLPAARKSRRRIVLATVIVVGVGRCLPFLLLSLIRPRNVGWDEGPCWTTMLTSACVQPPATCPGLPRLKHGCVEVCQRPSGQSAVLCPGFPQLMQFGFLDGSALASRGGVRGRLSRWSPSLHVHFLKGFLKRPPPPTAGSGTSCRRHRRLPPAFTSGGLDPLLPLLLYRVPPSLLRC